MPSANALALIPEAVRESPMVVVKTVAPVVLSITVSRAALGVVPNIDSMAPSSGGLGPIRPKGPPARLVVSLVSSRVIRPNRAGEAVDA